MKKTAVIFLAIMGLVWVASIALAGGAGPETITIDAAKKAMPAVTFPHWKHQEIVKGDCIKCHHKEKAGTTAMRPCHDCHGKVDGVPSMKDAMHKKCQGCHKEEKAAGKNPPLKCNGCHVRK
jgi:hypothetical protein